MVSGITEEIKVCIMGAEPVEVSYPEKGYHYTLEASPDKLSGVVRFFDEKGFYLECLLCTDYTDYLELVYFFNTHLSPCRVKVTLRIDPQHPVAPSMSAIYSSAYWYEREIHEFYGVLFTGHPNMAYLFLHNGIDDYPMRKSKAPVPPEDQERLDSFKPGEEEDTFFINLGPQL